MTTIKLTPETPGLTISVIAIEDDRGIPQRDSDNYAGFASDIQDMVKDHGLWGWCQVTVRVEFCGLKEESYLGGCSYKSAEDFRAIGGYYEDMVQECIVELQERVNSLHAMICVES